MTSRSIEQPPESPASHRSRAFPRSVLSLLLPLFLLLLPSTSFGIRFPPPAGTTDAPSPIPSPQEGAVPVELKNGEGLCVSVPLGSDNGVKPSSDFRLILPDGRRVFLYPAEIHARRFWSQPLSDRDYAEVTVGALASPYLLAPAEHELIREKGEERGKELSARREEERREAARKEVEGLAAARSRLLDRSDDLERRIARAEQEVAREEEALFRRNDSDEADADRVRAEIDDLTDRRQELSDQRAAPAIGKSSKAEADRITREIRDLSNRISAARDRLRTIRDRRRGNRSGYDRAVLEFRNLTAERRGVEGEIREADRKIREKERPSPR